MKRTIKILDHLIDVYIEDPKHWTHNRMGTADTKSATIRIREDMAIDIQCSTFLHELIHIICDFNSIELSEQVLDAMALGIFSFMKNNNNFLENFTQKRENNE